MHIDKNEAGNLLPKVFTFNPSNQPVQVEMIDHQPWFVATDVCEILMLKNPTDILAKGLDDDERLTYTVYRSGQKRKVNLVNESGLYNLIFKSRKPEAKAFRKWVTSEVLPSIRKTGSYPGKPQRKAVVKRSRKEVFKVEQLRMLWLIDANLERGDQTQIALELGVTIHAVQGVLRGTLRSSRILWALYQKALENRRNTENIYMNPQEAIKRLERKEISNG